MSVFYYDEKEPRVVRETAFLPDMNRAGEIGWSGEPKESKFLSSTALAEEIATMFVDIVAKAERGLL